MSVGEKIKEIRKSKGLTQKQLAEKIGIAEITIRKYEKGERQPSTEQLVSIVNALEVPVSQLMSNDEIIDLKLEQLHTMIDKYAAGETSYLLNMLNPYKEILELYDQLNALGKEKVIEYINDLLESDKYKEGE